MVLGGNGYTFRSPLVHIDGTLYSGRYISVVLRGVALLFIRAVRNVGFQQNNARLYVAGIVLTFLNTENVQSLPWPSSFLDISTIEKVWSMVAEQQSRHHVPVTTVSELGHRVKGAWVAIPLYVVQTLLDSMPRHVCAIISVRGDCSAY